MFGRLLWKLLRSNRGRLAVALVAVISGAAVISALLNLQFDVERKLTQEFRLLGANLVISSRYSGGAGAPGGGVAPNPSAPGLMSADTVLLPLERLHAPDVVAAPFLYVVARSHETPIVVAGTWLDELRKLEPTWKIQGAAVTSRDDALHCLIGHEVARQFGLAPGAQIELSYVGRSARLNVAGIVDAGGAEDSQVFVSLPVAQKLSDLDGQVQFVQMSVGGSAANIRSYAARLASSLPGFDVRPVRAITDAEANLLGRTRLLIVSMIALILVLTALCVLATMAALSMERRADVGLMKALGGTISRIAGLFLAEVGVLGAAGGLIGCIAGVALAQWMGKRVFGASITVRWEIFPLTIAMMMAVSIAGALPLRALGRVKPAVILRGE